MSWREICLGQAIKVKHGFAFDGKFFASHGEFMVLTPGNFLERGGFRVRPGKERFYLGDFPNEYTLEAGDLIVAMTEQGEGLLGSSAWIPESGKYLHNQRLGLISACNPDLLDKRFLYWLFNTPIVRGQIRGSATGTKVRHTAPERIYRVTVAVPHVTAQRRIAQTLDAYDDLIQNNQRRIKLLEEAAQRLYHEWFVALRFPGHERVTVVHGVPHGWKLCNLGDVCEAVGGATPTTTRADYWDGDITWLTPTDVTRNACLFLSDSQRKITAAGLESCSSHLLPAGTIFMTSRASIGYFAVLDQPACTNQGFISIVPNRAHSRAFILFHFMSRVEEFVSRSTGSTFLELSKKTFRAMECIWPPDDVLEGYSVRVEPMLRQIEALKKQHDAARQARDALLSRLMSGALAV